MKITEHDTYILKNWGPRINGKKVKYKRYAPEHSCYEFRVLNEQDLTIGIPKYALEDHLTKVFTNHVIESVSENYTV